MTTRSPILQILVVDDEDDMCWALRQIVVARGHNCTVAKTSQEALQLVEHASFDLAFVDVKLPDLDGFELVRRMAARRGALPCVLVSGFLYEDDELVQDALASRLIAGFIGKPFLLAQIQDELARVAEQKQDAETSGPRSGQGGGQRIPLSGISTPRTAALQDDRVGHSGEDATRNPKPPRELEARGGNPREAGTRFA